jgi:lambda repressor-like predicted transcriptional regulator
MKEDATDIRIFALRRQGNTLREIAKAVGLAETTVRTRLLQNGKFPGRIRLRNHFPQEKARVIFSMREKGVSLRRIADEIGYSYETVRTVLRKSDRPLARPSFTVTCSIKGCKRRHYARGYCKTHWTRSRNGRMDAAGNLIPLQHFCSRCGRTFFSPPALPSAQKCDGCRWKPPKAEAGRTQAKVRKPEPVKSFQQTLDHSISNENDRQI